MSTITEAIRNVLIITYNPLIPQWKRKYEEIKEGKNSSEKCILDRMWKRDLCMLLLIGISIHFIAWLTLMEILQTDLLLPAPYWYKYIFAAGMTCMPLMFVAYSYANEFIRLTINKCKTVFTK